MPTIHTAWAIKAPDGHLTIYNSTWSKGRAELHCQAKALNGKEGYRCVQVRIEEMTEEERRS
ncbi:hypothetical protein M0R72_15190 [Candidatus Pacearchaeota archaeon]|jgi:hypothetical protein|nr:hypothetical protein [Candidatus Pacearchaeota archaeon]